MDDHNKKGAMEARKEERLARFMKLFFSPPLSSKRLTRFDGGWCGSSRQKELSSGAVNERGANCKRSASSQYPVLVSLMKIFFNWIHQPPCCFRLVAGIDQMLATGGRKLPTSRPPSPIQTRGRCPICEERKRKESWLRFRALIRIEILYSRTYKMRRIVEFYCWKLSVGSNFHNLQFAKNSVFRPIKTTPSARGQLSSEIRRAHSFLIFAWARICRDYSVHYYQPRFFTFHFKRNESFYGPK